MKPTAKIMIILIVLLSNAAFSQKEGNIWYFGDNAGLDFNSGSPVALTDGQIVTEEGSSVICDANGNLMFYTDGVTVWNKLHAVMPNGTGLFGHSSSTQSGVIVPKPGNANIYYIFTVTDKWENYGFRYSIVDMTLDGGNGDVTTKNQLLFSPCVEKITSVKHKNNSDVWVIGHEWGNNTFRAYLITPNGINTIENATPGYPIISSQGAAHQGDNYNKIGYMKASSVGNKLALAVYEDGFFELFDFNNINGQITYYMSFTGIKYRNAYGVEFSPNGNLLYFSNMNNPSYLYQYDITLPTPTDILNSEYLVGNEPSAYYFGALQIAPDRKIYIAWWGNDKLHAIRNPNGYGAACNLGHGVQALSSRLSRWGLPTFIQTYFSFNFDLHTNAPLCPGDTLFLYCDTVENASYYWYGPNSFSSTQQNPIILNPSSMHEGWYYCEVTLYGLMQKDSIFVEINDKPNANAGPDKSICPSASTSIGLVATGGSPPYNYMWTPSSGLSSTAVYNPTASPVANTQYIVRVTDSKGCTDYDTVLVSIVDPVIAFPDGDTLDFGILCKNSIKNGNFRIQNASGFKTTFDINTTGMGALFTITGVIDDRQFNVNEIRNLSVRFNGNPVPGTFIDSFRVVDTCGDFKTAYLKAKVISFDMAVSPDTIDFGTFCKNVPKDSSFTVQNLSGFRTTLTTNTSFLRPFYIVNPAPFATPFNDNETKAVSIRFNGFSTNGSYLDSLWVIDSCGAHKTIFFKVKVFSPQIAALPDTLKFGVFCEPDTKDSSFILHNLSGFATNFTGEILPSPNPHFEFTDNSFFFDYLIDEQRVIGIRFIGGGFEGTYIDSLRITDECGTKYKIILKAVITNLRITYFPDSLYLCHNTDTTRIWYSFAGGTPPFTYNWWPSAGLSTTTLSIPTITNPVNTTYHLVITDKNGCQAIDSVKVKAIPTPNLTFNPNPMDFGLLDSCESQKDLTLRVTNNGSELVILSDSSTNPNYTVIGSHTRTIDPGEYTDLMVRVTRHKGKSGDSITGRLLFRTQACGDLYFVDLKSMIKGETIAISSSGLDYGEVPECDNLEYTKKIVIYNLNKSLDAEIGTPTFVPADKSFRIVTPSVFPSVIHPLDSLVITIGYKPRDIGIHNSDLAFPFIIGECISVLSANLTGRQTETELTAAPDNLNFGDLTGCQDTISKTITLTNTGTSDIISIRALFDGNIEIDSMDLYIGDVLKPGEQRKVKITFHPATNGEFDSEIKFRYEPCNEEVNVDYEGNKYGVNFATADTISFGDICYNDNINSQKKLTVMNISEGGQSGTIKDFRISGDFVDKNILSINMNLGDKLENGSEKTYQLNFNPDKPGEYTGSLEIMFSPCDITKTVTLKANLPKMEIRDMPDSIILCHDVDSAFIRYELVGGLNPQYDWKPKSGLDAYNVKEPNIKAPQNITYILTVTDDFGCKVTDTVRVIVKEKPNLTFMPDIMDFGTMDSCETIIEKELKITNNGSKAVWLESSKDNSNFAIIGDGDFSIGPKETKTLKIRYSRSLSDDTLQYGRISFLSPECGDVFDVSMQVKVKGKIIAVSNPLMDFGDFVDCDFTDNRRTVTLTNTNANLDVVIDAYSIIPSATELKVIEPVSFPLTLSPGQTANITVEFNPESVIKIDNELKMPFTMGECNDLVSIKIIGNYVIAKLAADKNAVTFKDLTGCQDIDSSIVTLTNEGSADIDSIYSVLDQNLMLYPDALELQNPLKPGESRQVMVYFKPNKNGAINGKAEFVYMPCKRTIPLTYSGSKLGTNFAVTESVDFGTLTVCTDSTVTLPVKLTNISEGNVEGKVTNCKISGSIASNGICETNVAINDILNTGESKDYNITFKALKPGSFDGILEVEFQPCAIKKQISLRAKAVDIGFAAKPRVIIDSIRKNSPVEKVIKFTNTGSADITVSGIKEPRSPVTVKKIEPQLPAIIKPGNDVEVTIECGSGDKYLYKETIALYGEEPCPFIDSAEVQIKIIDFASAMSILIPCPADSAEAGTVAHIPVYYWSTPDMISTDKNEFDITLRFNSSLLYPIDENITENKVENGIRTVTFRKNTEISNIEGTICTIPFVAALGNSKCTDIEITGFKWIEAPYNVNQLVDGCFCLANICPDYGDRLVNPAVTVAIKSIRPNPAEGIADVEFLLNEKGFTKMTIVNLFGEQIKTVFEGEAAAGLRNEFINTRELPSGSYYIVLITPTVTRVSKLEVVK